MNRRYFFDKCHYCICTACSRFKCPWRHKLYKECWRCQERSQKVPRLDCDYFCHYLKSKHFKFKRRSRSELHHTGTYLLLTEFGAFKGSYKDLSKLQMRIGGNLRQFNIFDFGDDE